MYRIWFTQRAINSSAYKCAVPPSRIQLLFSRKPYVVSHVVWIVARELSFVALFCIVIPSNEHQFSTRWDSLRSSWRYGIFWGGCINLIGVIHSKKNKSIHFISFKSHHKLIYFTSCRIINETPWEKIQVLSKLLFAVPYTKILYLHYKQVWAQFSHWSYISSLWTVAVILVQVREETRCTFTKQQITQADIIYY